MSRLKFYGAVAMVIALAATTSFGYLLQNSFFDETIVWDDGLGWERFPSEGPPVTQEDWASGSPGEFGAFGVEGDGNLGVAHRCDFASGGGFVQVVPGIVPGEEYYLEIHSHAGSGSAAGDAWPTTSVFNIDMEWFVGDPDTIGSNLSTSATVIDPTDGGSDGGFPPGYSLPNNWDYWFITNTAPALATHMRLTIKWDGGVVSTNSSAAVRWDNALLTTSALDPLGDSIAPGDVLRLSYNTQSAVTYNVESAADLTAGFGAIDGFPGVAGDGSTQEVFVAGNLDADTYRLKVVETPIDISNLTIVPWLSTPNWQGYMTVFNLPAPDGDGAWQFGEPWGVGDLVTDVESTVSNSVLTLSVNSIDDPAEYWYIGGGAPGNPGNKIMDANLYREFPGGEYAGVTVTFTGEVLANTVSNSHSVTAFIRDFAPDYSSFIDSTTNLASGSTGPFSISLTTDAGANRHVQYGFNFNGPCVWIDDAPAFGNVQLSVDTGFIPDAVNTDLDLDTGTVVSWDAQLGVNYQVEYSDDFGANYEPLGSVIQGDGTVYQVTDPEGDVSGRLYRVVVTPTATPPPSS